MDWLGLYRYRCGCVLDATLIMSGFLGGLRWIILSGLIAGLSGCLSHPTAPVRDLSPVKVSQGSYAVQHGDTLYSISFRTGLDYKQLARYNQIKSPYTIYVGERLRLAAPPPSLRPKPRPVPPKAPTAVAQKPIQQTPALPAVSLPKRVTGWVWPTKGKLLAKFSQASGSNGIDINSSRGAPVAASAAGQVVYAGEGIRGYGKLIIVKHSDEYLSAYAHNEQMLVKEGATVKQGQTISTVGSTGTASPKLHFEIRKSGKPVNPLKYLPLLRG